MNDETSRVHLISVKSQSQSQTQITSRPADNEADKLRERPMLSTRVAETQQSTVSCSIGRSVRLGIGVR